MRSLITGESSVFPFPLAPYAITLKMVVDARLTFVTPVAHEINESMHVSKTTINVTKWTCMNNFTFSKTGYASLYVRITITAKFFLPYLIPTKRQNIPCSKTWLVSVFCIGLRIYKKTLKMKEGSHHSGNLTRYHM